MKKYKYWENFPFTPYGMRKRKDENAVQINPQLYKIPNYFSNNHADLVGMQEISLDNNIEFPRVTPSDLFG